MKERVTAKGSYVTIRQMKEKIPWTEIEALYDQQWVELIDFDWEETEPFPTAGRVRVHSRDRREFNQLIKRDMPIDSAILFVGRRHRQSGTFLSSNLRQVTPNERVRD